MSARFHLAIPVGNLMTAIDFYCNKLGCKRGMSEFKYPDAWCDIDFWDNELTLHSSDPNERAESDFADLKQRIKDNNVEYIDPPYVRFEGTELEQETMFLADPHGNCMEIKTMKNPKALFNK